MHFTLDQTGVLYFWSPGISWYVYIDTSAEYRDEWVRRCHHNWRGRIQISRNKLIKFGWNIRRATWLPITGSIGNRQFLKLKWNQSSDLELWRRTGESLNSDALRAESPDHLESLVTVVIFSFHYSKLVCCKNFKCHYFVAVQVVQKDHIFDSSMTLRPGKIISYSRSPWNTVLSDRADLVIITCMI